LVLTIPRKPKNPGYVTKTFCDERTRRIEERIDSNKDEILAAIHNKTHSSLSGRDKTAVVSSVIIAVASIIVALVK